MNKSVALVTGASRGVGRGIAIALVDAGFTVFATGRNIDKGWLDLSNSESPEFSGRVIAALARHPKLMERTGKVIVAAELAHELGVKDIDGRQPNPLTLQSS